MLIDIDIRREKEVITFHIESKLLLVATVGKHTIAGMVSERQSFS